jgi:hypothetical protein
MAKGFGRVQKHRQALEKSKDRLSELNAIIPWAVFRSCLEQLRPPERKSNAGRKPIGVKPRYVFFSATWL